MASLRMVFSFASQYRSKAYRKSSNYVELQERPLVATQNLFDLVSFQYMRRNRNLAATLAACSGVLVQEGGSYSELTVTVTVGLVGCRSAMIGAVEVRRTFGVYKKSQ